MNSTEAMDSRDERWEQPPPRPGVTTSIHPDSLFVFLDQLTRAPAQAGAPRVDYTQWCHPPGTGGSR
jgi:hypothetical protein